MEWKERERKSEEERVRIKRRERKYFVILSPGEIPQVSWHDPLVGFWRGRKKGPLPPPWWRCWWEVQIGIMKKKKEERKKKKREKGKEDEKSDSETRGVIEERVRNEEETEEEWLEKGLREVHGRKWNHQFVGRWLMSLTLWYPDILLLLFFPIWIPVSFNPSFTCSSYLFFICSSYLSISYAFQLPATLNFYLFQKMIFLFINFCYFFLP